MLHRIFTTLALLGCANCGVSGTNAAAGEQTADPVAEAEAEPAPVEVRPVDAALIVISKESMSLAVYDFCSRGRRFEATDSRGWPRRSGSGSAICPS